MNGSISNTNGQGQDQASGVGGANNYQNLVNEVVNNSQIGAMNNTVVVSSLMMNQSDIQTMSLEELEIKLENEVDDEFFEDPIKFNKTLQRVIDVLGAQFYNSGEEGSATDMTKNPAYMGLQRQMKAVEHAVEVVAIAHCSELNESVVAVGKVSRQFNEAVSVVKKLRTQVRSIKETLNPNHSQYYIKEDERRKPGEKLSLKAVAEKVQQQQKKKKTAVKATRSLRELWLKKLECEAVLSILDKLVIIRDAPSAFDALVQPRNGGSCRIIAAVTHLSEAITTMFSDDLSQVMAVTKVMDQLMSRKQRAEEIVWETLMDVLYLRTGNSKQAELLAQQQDQQNSKNSKKKNKNRSMVPGFYNSIIASHFDVSDDKSNDDNNSYGSDDSSDDDATQVSTTSGSNSKMKQYQCKRVIPKTYLDEEIDLEEEEKLLLEDGKSTPWDPRYPNESVLFRPKYSDATLALRLLVEAITKLGRLDDVERTLNETIDVELRRIAEREQMRTLQLLEKRRGKNAPLTVNTSNAITSSATTTRESVQPLPMEFKYHLSSLLFSFGNVLLRLAHLAQIIRHNICTNTSLVTPSYPVPAQALHSVLTSAYSRMQREIKLFLRATVESSIDGMNNNLQNQRNARNMDNNLSKDAEYGDRGIFSLGVISDGNTNDGKKSSKLSSYSISNIVVLNADTFVTTILLPRTHTVAQPRFALNFRRVLERWTHDCGELKKELALVSGNEECMGNTDEGEGALHYLDSVISSRLLPVLQENAVNNIVAALEKPDAFDPDIDSPGINSYSDPKEQHMCYACKSMLENAMPLLNALHKLPRGEKMFAAVVAVLDYAMLTFLSRVKTRVQDLCVDKTAYELLGNYDASTEPKEGGKQKSGKESLSLAAAMETRRAYGLFLSEYYGTNSDDISTILFCDSQANGNTKSLLNGARNPSSANFDHYASDLEKEHKALEKEVKNLLMLLKFVEHGHGCNLIVCTDEEIKKASCLAHSLLQFSVILLSSLQHKKTKRWKKSCTNSLRDALCTIQRLGLYMVKFCRIDMLVQVVKRTAQIPKSSAIISRDTIRLPACVNDLGEFLSNASDVIRESASNAITAYTFSSLEQFIPLLLMQSVRVIASEGTKITLNGIESLDRCGSVLYRDLKGAATVASLSIENGGVAGSGTAMNGGNGSNFWDETAAADAFERSASFLALLELTMDELEKYWREHTTDFSEEDYKLLFSINCPRRTGDLELFNRLREEHLAKLENEKIASEEAAAVSASNARSSRKGKNLLNSIRSEGGAK